ncbi:MAG TPA: hypothetical protein VGS21_06835, partial [Acidimicrobiales bacterium]|nr:hypothetical protein [Acidimicrobiales bacterium]
MPLEPLDDVRRLILGAVSRLDTLLVSLESAYGHVLAEDITAPEDVPPFANTAMDGFAVRAADTEGAGSAGAGSGGEGSGGEGGAGPLSLNVVGTLAAGHSTNREVGPGEAMRIMTGAPLPAGADAVVMVENTSPADDPDRVLIHAPARQGDHVRLPG